MIAHVSMPADDCEVVARFLAGVMHGGSLRFPPGGPNAWNCWSKDNAFQIVVTPRGSVMVPGPTEQAWVKRSPSGGDRACESHFAIAVPTSAADVLARARARGWLARLCNRGGMFDVVEVWIENAYLVEILDPTQLADYERTMTVEGFAKTFGLTS